MDDPFIRNYIEDLLRNVRTQVLLKIIKPYTRIRIPFISKVNWFANAVENITGVASPSVCSFSNLKTEFINYIFSSPLRAGRGGRCECVRTEQSVSLSTVFFL